PAGDFWELTCSKMFYEKVEEVKPQDHWDLKMDQNLDYNDLGPGWNVCSRCQHSWSSVQVVILFHMYLDQHRRKGWVKMRVFRQECYECSEGKLEEPNFKEESVQRVLENLVISIREKCYGEYVAQLSEVTVIGQHYGPHRSDHCEACRLGIHQSHAHLPSPPLLHQAQGVTKRRTPPFALESSFPLVGKGQESPTPQTRGLAAGTTSGTERLGRSGPANPLTQNNAGHCA
uniref:Receptor transporter protein 1 n=1 Tax=Chelonoidis abingdonii TaxID=106734 RepID=A0A8C0GEI7_CHEAB